MTFPLPRSLLVVCFFLSSLAMQAQSPGFVRTDLATTGAPQMASTADFNLDGKPDIISLNSTTGSISIRFGNGDGTFGTPITTQVGTYITSMAVGDLNRDGIPDVVTNEHNSYVIHVLIGNGDGTFRAATPLPSLAENFALGDFNGDGKLDIASVNGGIQASVYLGNGDGTFGPVELITSLQAYSLEEIRAVDADRDGKLDLIMSFSSEPNGFAIVLGNGDGTFQSFRSYFSETSGPPPALAVADVNTDHIPDVIVNNGFQIGVSLGNGDGTFRSALLSPFAPDVNAITIGDVNGDGKPDLLAVSNLLFVTILLGNGDGTFGDPVNIPCNSGFSIASGDFNRDGKLDLLVADVVSNAVSVFQNTGNITCSYSVQFPFLTPLPSGGATGVASVSALDNCPWTATSSDQSWLLTSTEQTQGSGQVTITASPNLFSSSRSATVTIADQTFTVNQDADVCGVVLSSPLFTPGVTLVTIGSEGTVTSFTITVAPGCTWTAKSQLPQVTLSSYSGTGTSTISVTLAPNTGQETFPGFSIGPQLFEFDELGNQQDFSDVLPSAYYFTAVNLLQSKNITAGCGVNPPLYCPTQDVTRAQMAIFIVRTILGTDVFPYSPAPYFTDVPTGSFGFAWIQKLKDLGITAGCQTDLFCPNSTVTRDQMAVFLIRARYGASTVFDYPAIPYFTDVPNTDFAFPWIQRLREDAITSGCGPSIYCPTEPVTRGDMAIFLMRAGFNQLLPPLEPVITQVSPATVGVGQTALLTITGLNTNFVQGVTVVSPIAGFTLGAVTVSSPTTLTVQVTAAATSGAQPESVLVITGTEEAVLPNALSIP